MINSNAFGCAAWKGEHKMLEALLKRYGTDHLEARAKESNDQQMYSFPLRKKEVHGFTPLMLAAAAKEAKKTDLGLECLKLLIRYGADVNCKDGDGNSILHIAGRFKNNRVLKYIINCD